MSDTTRIVETERNGTKTIIVEDAEHNVVRIDLEDNVLSNIQAPLVSAPDGASRSTSEESERQITIQSESSPSRSYVVTMEGDTPVRCSCPDHTYRRDDYEECKHMQRARRQK